MSKFLTISNQKEFASVYKEALKWHCKDAVIFFRPFDVRKLAVVASKRVGNAVVRNRCKRLLRAVFIEIGISLRDGIYIVVAKDQLAKSDYAEVKKNLSWSLKKLGCMK
ncbi:MAG: ribonuclease P protein component [Campylobacter sp.]